MNNSSKQQSSARNIIRHAVRMGIVSKPDKCQSCGEAERYGADGRSLLHAHHEDHSKPVDIIWLCVPCHRNVTPIPRGERNGTAVLRDDLVIAARLLRKNGFSIQAIADLYGMSRPGLSHAVNGTNWKHIPEERAKPENQL